jgi:hypothetical protein
MSRTVALLLLLFAMVPVDATGAGGSSETPTQIVKFAPAAVATTSREGRCWTNSIAAPRPDAWRCMEGSEIFDPCFEAADRKSVVCIPDPAGGDDGFGLKLTEPLPKPEITGEAAAMGAGSGWLVELADGTRCRPATGARGVLEGKMITHYCESPPDGPNIVLLEDLSTTEPQWMAEKATLLRGANASRPLKSEKVAVKTVWQ